MTRSRKGHKAHSIYMSEIESRSQGFFKGTCTSMLQSGCLPPPLQRQSSLAPEPTGCGLHGVWGLQPHWEAPPSALGHRKALQRVKIRAGPHMMSPCTSPIWGEGDTIPLTSPDTTQDPIYTPLSKEHSPPHSCRRPLFLQNNWSCHFCSSDGHPTYCLLFQ